MFTQQFAQNLIAPYMVDSDIRIQFLRTTTYGEQLQAYDKSLKLLIQASNAQLLNQVVAIYDIIMQPQMIQWKIMKSLAQMQTFLKDMQDPVKQMSQDNDKLLNNGQKIKNMLEKQFKVKQLEASQACFAYFAQFLNQISHNLYLCKTEQFLLFIEHCVPVDKWDMKIYKHIEVFREAGFASKIQGFFSSSANTRAKDYFITITSDGILKSDSHLLQSRIILMVPFTNQLTITCQQSTEKYISFVIQSCAHQQLIISFFAQYEKAINFIIALKTAMEDSNYRDPRSHRFSSYSPVREHCASKLYNDGEQYFLDMYNCLKAAKWQVCMTGWMITPYFLLKRPNSIKTKQARLDGVLQQLAERGVKIYIIVFMEPKYFVNNDSQYVQTYMESLHDNIKVYRHPNNAIPILWSHHEKLMVIDQQIGFMGGLDICYGRWDNCHHSLFEPFPNVKYWDGADYNNYRIKDITTPRLFQKTNLQEKQVRMPWHDIAIQFRGDVVLDLLRHFIQYWYFVKAQLLTDPFKLMGFLKKRYEQAFYNPKTATQQQQMKFYLKQIKKRQESATFTQKMKYMFNGRQQRFSELLMQKRAGKRVGNQILQMCRSASEWSIGVKPYYNQITQQHVTYQDSIHQAYIALIKDSKNFIYIENQFFMGLQNRIVEALAQRVTRAYKNKQKFKIIVVMPLLPAFEGDIGNPASTVLRIQVHYQFQAILRGQKSLFRKLGFITNINEYVHYFGLRQSQVSPTSGMPVTQIVYVHSKLLIVDDVRCIIGSANINDRSLLGKRDSELACIIEQKDGNIANLRCRLFKQHFGLTQRQSMNITRDQVWYSVLENARNATLFYRQVFGCIPDDTVTLSQQINGLLIKSSLAKYQQGRGKLKGHAVDFPLNFMQDQVLTFRMDQKEYLAPQQSFT